MSSLLRLLPLIGVALTLPACSLIVRWEEISSPDPPVFATRDVILECTVTVRNPGAANDVGMAPELTLSSRTPPTEKLYYETGDCAADIGFGFDTVADAEDDWSIFAHSTVEQLEADPQSIPGVFPGDWCAVAETLRCDATDEPVVECTATPRATGEPLPECPPLPPGPCLGISCNGDARCEEFDFGAVELGESGRVTVRLANCGEQGAPEPVVRLNPTVLPASADFRVVEPVGIGGESCLDTAPDEPDRAIAAGESCRFDVEFAPGDPRDHAALVLFTSNARHRAHRIDLQGTGVGGALRFQLDGAALPVMACDRPVAGEACTAERNLNVFNEGPGAVLLESFAMLDTGEPQGFVHTLVAPPSTPLWLAAGEDVDIRFRWCSTDQYPGDGDRSTLQVQSNDPEDPTFTLDLVQCSDDGRCPEGCDVEG